MVFTYSPELSGESGVYSQIEKQDAVLKTGAVIPMGRDRKKGVREMMMEYGRKHGSRLCD